MATIRFSGIILTIAGLSLILQLLILLRSECHLSNRREWFSLSTVDRDSPRQVYNRIQNYTIQQSLRIEPKAVSMKAAILRRYLTIGIPTIRRKDDTYVFNMLDSMLNKTASEDLSKIVFVVFFADLNETNWTKTSEDKIKSKHSEHIQSGSLRIIEASPTFYPGMELNETKYLRWRRKQNYDYAYLMKNSENISEYYMQMEDDVIASDGYFDAIKNFIHEQADDTWTCLEFSELGFIGKLYHSHHLNKLADMLLMFSHSQPVDYTFLYFNILMGQGDRKIRKPTLFQHMGYHSSLTEKVQPLKDRYYDFRNKTFIGDNPNATIRTTLQVVPDFPPELAYSKEPGYFWSGAAPNEGDTFTVIFEEPQIVTSCIIHTGSIGHPGDIVENGVLEGGSTLSENRENCHDFVVLGNFENGALNVTDIKPKMGLFKMKCLQIRLTKPQVPWIIISELAVFVQKS